MTRMHTQRRRSAGGFTLVEILIVTFVLSLFLLSMAFILKGGLKLYTRNSATSTLKQQAFTALERIAADWRQNYNSGVVSSGSDLIIDRKQTNPADSTKPFKHTVTYHYDAAKRILTREDLKKNNDDTVVYDVTDTVATNITPAPTWSNFPADPSNLNLKVSVTASWQGTSGETVTFESTLSRRALGPGQTQPSIVVYEVPNYPNATQAGRPRPSGPRPVVW